MATQAGPLSAEELALIKAAVAAAAANTPQPTHVIQVPAGGGSGRTVQPLPSQTSLQELGRELLQQAADGRVDKVRQLIKQGAPFTTDWLGTSPLHMAAMYGHYEVAEALLEAGTSLDPRTKVDRTPLHMAASEGFANIVELLLKKEAEINCRDMLNMTPLHWAVQRRHIPCIEWLLRCGADLDVENKFDKTPRDIASDDGKLPIMEVLENYEVYRADNPLVRTSAAAAAATEEAVKSILPDLGAGPPVDGLLSPDRPALPPTPPPPPPEPSADAAAAAAASLDQSVDGMSTLAAMAEAADVARRLAAPPPPPPGAPSPGDDAGRRAGKTEALRLLASHGITMLPVDDASTVPAALTSGKTISLTAAGALALGVTKPTADSAAAAAPRTADAPAVPAATAASAPRTATAAPAATKPPSVRNGKVSKIIKLTPEQFAKLTAARPAGAAGKTPLSLKLPLGSLKKAARPAEPGDSPAKRFKFVSLGAPSDPNGRLTVGAAARPASSDAVCPDGSDTADVAALRAQLTAAEREVTRLRQLCREKEAEVERCRRLLAAATGGQSAASL